MRAIGLVLAAVLVGTLSVAAGAQTTVTMLIPGGGPDVWAPVFAEFEKVQPDIRVEPIYVSGRDGDTKFQAMLAAGLPPDVFLNASVFGWARYAHDGLFMDLTPYFEQDAAELDLDDIPANSFEAASFRGALYGFPGLQTGFGVNYNATYMNEAGLALPPTDWNDPSWNWQTMVEYAKKLLKTDGQGLVTRWGVDFWDADNLIAFSWGFGGDWFSEESYATRVVEEVTLATQVNVTAYEAVAGLRTESQVRPGAPALGPSPGWPSFANGDIAMWIDTIEGANLDPAKVASIAQYQWGFAPFPYAAGVDRTETFSWGGPMYAIPVGAEHPDEAWKLLKFLSYRIVPGLVNPRLSVAVEGIHKWVDAGLSGLPREQVVAVIAEALQRGVALPRTYMVGASEVWDAFRSYVRPALSGTRSVPEALEAAQQVAAGTIEQLRREIGVQ